MTAQTQEANERLALLLGWFPDADGWWAGPIDRRTRNSPPRVAPPDYSSWKQFPELQEYVRGLPPEKVQAIEERLWEMLGAPPPRRSFADEESILVVWDITPTILGNAILEVCDAE